MEREDSDDLILTSLVHRQREVPEAYFSVGSTKNDKTDSKKFIESAGDS